MSNLIDVRNLACSFNEGRYRVSADVGGTPLWFESADVQLVPSPEAFAGILLFQALISQLNLRFDRPLSAVWLDNARQLMEIFQRWWGYRPIEIHADERNDRLRDKGNRTALLFSGGVDSFFSLLKGPFAINDLVFIQGCDVRLGEADRLTFLDSCLRAVSGQVGAKAVSIRTNLREHPFAGRKYRLCHGGILSSIGHLLPDVNRLMISSSARKGTYDRPHSSHWETDPLWGDESLEVVHFGEEFGRLEKLRAIAEEPVVQRNLFICQGKIENRKGDPEHNCGKCEKCVRTMLALKGIGVLGRFSNFKEKENLMANLDKILFSSRVSVHFYKEILKFGLDEELDRSVRLLLKRTARLRWFDRFNRRTQKAFAHLMLPERLDRRIVRFLRALWG